LGAINAGLAKGCERRGQVTLGEAAAVVVNDERMMELLRFGQA
jgi:hypothetical protein